MNNLSLANKYRPRKFEDVLGQEPTVKALVGKIKEGRLPRTSLFCGAHGSGKTTLARIVAKAINCEGQLDENGNPCCKCESCQQIDAGVSSDVYELDAASHNKVEDVEKLKPIISELSKTHRIYAESMGKYRDNPETRQSMLDMGYNVFMGNRLYDFLAMVKERHFS